MHKLKWWKALSFTVLVLPLNAGSLEIETGLDPHLIAEILFSSPQNDVLFKWRDFPVFVSIGGNKTSQIEEMVSNIVTEINIASGFTVLEILPDNARLTEAQIYLVISNQENHAFSAYYQAVFEQWFGPDETAYWDDQNAFSVPYSLQHPCFGFGVVSTEQYYTAGYGRTHVPEFTMISIGGWEDRAEEKNMGCLREELAHEVFFIPDWQVESGDISIFNSNPVPSPRNTFSTLDQRVMEILATPSIVHGMSMEEFVAELTHILHP